LATTAAVDSAEKRTVSSLVGIDLNFLDCKGPAGLFLTKGLRYRKSKDIVSIKISLNGVVGLVAIQHHKPGVGGAEMLARRLSLVSFFVIFLTYSQAVVGRVYYTTPVTTVPNSFRFIIVIFRGNMDEVTFFLRAATAPSWPGPHYRPFTITL
jgi:hypothetical protein